MAIAIILTEYEFEQRVDKRVESIIVKYIDATSKPIIRKTNLDINEAIKFLISIGYKCSLSQIYKKTMANEIIHSKFGRRISFNADDLTEWVESQKTKTVDIAGTVARSANLKINQ